MLFEMTKELTILRWFFQIIVLLCVLGKSSSLMIILNYNSNSRISANELILRTIKIKSIKIQFNLNHMIFLGEIQNTFRWKIIYTKYRKKILKKHIPFTNLQKHSSLPSKNKSKQKNIKRQTAINNPDSCQLIADIALTVRLWCSVEHK